MTDFLFKFRLYLLHLNLVKSWYLFICIDSQGFYFIQFSYKHIIEEYVQKKPKSRRSLANSRRLIADYDSSSQLVGLRKRMGMV